MGKLLNFLLGGKRPHDDPRTVKKTKSIHPLDIYVRKAMEICLTRDTKNRSLVKEVANLLSVGYSKLEALSGDEKDEERKASVIAEYLVYE